MQSKSILRGQTEDAFALLTLNSPVCAAVSIWASSATSPRLNVPHIPPLQMNAPLYYLVANMAAGDCPTLTEWAGL